MSLWKEASPEETDRIIEKVAREVVERELDLPATLLIGTFRPISYIGGQLGRVFLAPFTPFFEKLPYEYISVFEKNENLIRLINRIRELGEEKETEKKKKKEELKGEKRRGVFDWIRGLIKGKRESSPHLLNRLDNNKYLILFKKEGKLSLSFLDGFCHLLSDDKCS